MIAANCNQSPEGVMRIGGAGGPIGHRSTVILMGGGTTKETVCKGDAASRVYGRNGLGTRSS